MDQHYPLFTADTVEDFWKNFVHVPEPRYQPTNQQHTLL